MGVGDGRARQPQRVVIHLAVEGNVRVKGVPAHRAGGGGIDIGLQLLRQRQRVQLLGHALLENLGDVALQPTCGRPDALGEHAPVGVQPAVDHRPQRLRGHAGQRGNEAVVHARLGGDLTKVLLLAFHPGLGGPARAVDRRRVDALAQPLNLLVQLGLVGCEPALGQAPGLRGGDLLFNGLGRAAVQLLNQPVGDGDLGQQFPARGAHQALMQIHSAHRPA